MFLLCPPHRHHPPSPRAAALLCWLSIEQCDDRLSPLLSCSVRVLCCAAPRHQDGFCRRYDSDIIAAHVYDAAVVLKAGNSMDEAIQRRINFKTKWNLQKATRYLLQCVPTRAGSFDALQLLSARPRAS